MCIWIRLRRVLVILLTSTVSATYINAQEDDLVYSLAVAWSHDGTQIAVVGVRPENTQGYVRVIDVQTMQSVYQEDPLPGGFTSVAWSPDDRFIAAGSYDGTVWVFNLEEAAHTVTLQGHEATVDDVDWNSDGTRLVSAGDWDQSVILWDMTSYQSIRRLETPNFIYSVAFSPDSQRIAVGGETGLFIFPSTLEVGGDGRDQLAYQYIRGYSSVLAWGHSGQQIAFGTQTFPLSNGERPNAHIFIVDANDPTLSHDFESSWGSIAGLAWSPDDRLLAAYHQDDLVSILDTRTESIVETFTGSGPSRYSIGHLDFSPYYD
jgi:WD40 repeat protein